MYKKYFRITVVIMIVVLNTIYAYADGVMVIEVPGGTVIPAQQNEIRMLKEIVKVGYEKVDAIFTFSNTTNKQIRLNMGFPVEEDNEPLYFIAKVDGKEITARQKDIYKKISKNIKALKIKSPYSNYNSMYVWPIVFKPMEKKVVKCTYRVQWYGDPAQPKLVGRFDYVTKTGALWKGNIKRADFYIDIQGVRPIDIKNKRVNLKINPKGYKIINYRTVEWHFRNWKPTEDISITIWQNK